MITHIQKIPEKVHYIWQNEKCKSTHYLKFLIEIKVVPSLTVVHYTFDHFDFNDLKFWFKKKKIEAREQIIPWFLRRSTILKKTGAFQRHLND